MIPKKCNILYKQLSEELNISENLVDNLINFYYKDVRINLSNLTYPRINIIGLGHFVAKTYYIKNTIPRLEKKLLTHDVSTFNAYFNKKEIENKLEMLLKLQIKLDEQINKKDTFLKLKYNEPIKKDLEK